MKFESMRAWDDGLAMVKANRGVALPLAGVFFALPMLVLNLFTPNPAIDGTMTPQQQLTAIVANMEASLPYMMLAIVVQQAGMLALLTLFTDRSRPTVSQAIAQGFGGLLSYLGAMLLLALGGGLAGGLFMAIGAITGVMAVVVLMMAALLVFAIYVGIRTSLAAPVVAIERLRNPIHVLTRSWELTRGNTGRLLLFFLLIGLAYGIITAATVGVANVALTLLAIPRLGEIAAAVVQALVGAAYVTLQSGLMAAIHRQLAGPSEEGLRSTFN